MPHAHNVLKELEQFLTKLGRHECVMVLGDLNAQFPRGVSNLTGKWTMSKKGDKGNAPQVMSFMRRHGLVAANTFFQPPRGQSFLGHMAAPE